MNKINKLLGLSIFLTMSSLVNAVDVKDAVNQVVLLVTDIKDTVETMPGTLKDFESNANSLIASLKCLSAPGSAGCAALGCSDIQSCAGKSLAGFLLLLKSAVDKLVAQGTLTIDASGKETKFEVKPSLLVQVLGILSAVPIPSKIESSSAPAGLVNVLNSVFDKIRDLQTKAKEIVDQIKGTGNFNGKSTIYSFYKNFQFLNEIVAELNKSAVVPGIVRVTGGIPVVKLANTTAQDFAAVAK